MSDKLPLYFIPKDSHSVTGFNVTACRTCYSIVARDIQTIVMDPYKATHHMERQETMPPKMRGTKCEECNEH